MRQLVVFQSRSVSPSPVYPARRVGTPADPNISLGGSRACRALRGSRNGVGAKDPLTRGVLKLRAVGQQTLHTQDSKGRAPG